MSLLAPKRDEIVLLVLIVSLVAGVISMIQPDRIATSGDLQKLVKGAPCAKNAFRNALIGSGSEPKSLTLREAREISERCQDIENQLHSLEK